MHVPKVRSRRVVPVRQAWAVLVAEAPTGTRGTMPTLVTLGSSLQPLCLPTHGMASSLLAHSLLVVY